MRWDTIIVGSGVGGLTAAVALARAGQKVLVLEQHYLPGGWMHSFSLHGYRFSPGVHYIGDLHEGGGVRTLFEGLGLGDDLAFCELNPDGFEHFLIGSERIDQPKGRARWLAALCARFPDERSGLERYFRVLDDVVTDVKRGDASLASPRALLMLPFSAPSLLRWGLRTLDRLLSSCIHDPLLRAVLSARAGDHGLAPSRVSLPLHASVCAHYFEGAYYPLGGAARIPRAYVRELRRNRGEIRLGTRAMRILVEEGRACGVEAEDGEVHRANDVLCNADPAIVYEKLLPKNVCRRERRRSQRAEYSVSLCSAFLAVDMDLRALGYDSGNYWWYRTADVDGLYRRMEHELPERELDGLFLTITTLKDPAPRRHRHHTVVVAFKHRMREQMLDAAEHIIPTISPFSCSVASSLPHLFFCGASTLSHGVGGAAMSGLQAAQRTLGLSSFAELLSPSAAPLRIYSAEHPEEWLRSMTPATAD